jgi:hypothetical protein
MRFDFAEERTAPRQQILFKQRFDGFTFIIAS